MTGRESFSQLLSAVRACTLCDGLPLGPKPIVQLNPKARILINSQAPGRIAHEKDIAFLDPSGVRLRRWMGLSEDEFYNSGRIAILPTGFCFPGTGTGGDLPPRPICAPTWHERVMAQMPDIKLTLVIGTYAINARYAGQAKMTLTQRVKSGTGRTGDLFPMPHPSPRNNRWLKANPWFEGEVIPLLQTRIRALMD